MRKLTILLTLLTLSVGLAQAQSVFTYTATEKLESQFSKLGTVTSHEFSNGAGTVTYSSDITTIKYTAFKQCSTLQSITLPASVTTIGESAFHSCSALQTINLSHVTTIDKYAFGYCKALQSVTLPASVISIGDYAFAYCTSLADVTVAWTEADKIPAIASNVFEYIADNQGSAGATLHVPIGTKALYQAADVWKTFGTIDDPGVLIDAKAAAIEAIQSAADTAKAEIDAASEYPAADAIKAEHKNKVDNAVAEASAAINAASTVQEVSDQQSIYTSKIDVIVAEAEAAIAPINELEEYREKVIGEIEYARLNNLLPELDEEQQGFVNETIDDAVNAVKAATTTTEMDRAEARIFFILSMYPAGKAAGIEEGQTAALGEMGEPCTDCPIVEVKKGDKTIILYNPESVEFKKE